MATPTLTELSLKLKALEARLNRMALRDVEIQAELDGIGEISAGEDGEDGEDGDPGPGLTAGSKGPITVSADPEVWTLNDGVVTLAKMADLAAGKLIGRETGTGVPQALSVGGGLDVASGAVRRAALTGDVGVAAGGTVTAIANDAVSNAKLANVATATFKGRATAGTGDPEDLTGAQATALLNVATVSAKGLTPALSGDANTFYNGAGAFVAPPATTVTDNTITNAKLADVATATLKGRATAGTGDPEDLTAAQATALLSLVTRSLKGLVPPPGGAGTTRYFREDFAWVDPTEVMPTGLQQKISIPTYFPSGSADDADWLAVAAVGSDTAGIAILNPASGPGYTSSYLSPGGSKFLEYQARMTQLRAAGFKVVFYVTTNYRDNESSGGSVQREHRFTAATDDTITTRNSSGTANATGWTSGFGPIRIRLTDSGVGSLPGGLAENTNYYWHALTSTTGKFCTTKQNAIDGVSFVNVTSTGSGGTTDVSMGLSRTLANIQNVFDEIDAIYARWNPDGVFFDEMQRGGGLDGSTANTLSYYELIYDKVKTKGGLALVVQNPGAFGSSDEFLVGVADTFMSKETYAETYLAGSVPSWTLNHPADKFWHAAHTADPTDPALIALIRDKARADNAGHLYITDRILSGAPSPTPWGSTGDVWLHPASNLDDVIEAVEAANEATVAVENPYATLVYTGGALPATSSTSYVKVPGNSAAGPLDLFTHTSPNRLTYTGTAPRKFKIAWALPVTKTACPADVVMRLRLLRSGVSLADGVKNYYTLDADDTGFRILAGEYIGELSAGQYIELGYSLVQADGATALLNGIPTFTVREGGHLTIVPVDR